MIVIEYWANPNAHVNYQHRVGKVDAFTQTKQKRFENMTQALSFFNECFFPITSLEEIISSYRKEQQLNRNSIKRFYFN